MCRCIIVRRPTRVFFLRSILEPLGLHQDNPSPPVASHPSKLPSSTASDPWELIFPPDPTTYKLHDDADHCLRCPECMGEIEDGNCTTCGNNFSSDSEMEGQSDENFDNFDWLYDEEDESSEEFFAQRFLISLWRLSTINVTHLAMVLAMTDPTRALIQVPRRTGCLIMLALVICLWIRTSSRIRRDMKILS